MTDRQLSDNTFGAGLLFVGTAEVAALATALAPLLPQHSVGERRATMRAWLVAVIEAITAEPLAIATTSGALDLAELCRWACADRAGGDQDLRWSTDLPHLCIAGRVRARPESGSGPRQG